MAAHLASLVTLSLALTASVAPHVIPSLRETRISAFAQGGAVQSGDAVQLVLQGNTAFGERRFADALDAYTKASRILPQEANVHFMMGYSAYMLGQFSAAQAPLE